MGVVSRTTTSDQSHCRIAGGPVHMEAKLLNSDSIGRSAGLPRPKRLEDASLHSKAFNIQRPLRCVQTPVSLVRTIRVASVISLSKKRIAKYSGVSCFAEETIATYSWSCCTQPVWRT